MLCGALLAACASPTSFITVNPEPKNHAWWLRSEIRPFGVSVRGIPVRDINSNWCKANEFTLDLFPPEIRSGGDFPLDATLKQSGASFSVSGQFGRSPDLDVLVGVYETCSNERGTFLITVQDLGASKRVVDVVKASNSSHFAVLHRAKEDRIELWWCFACDFFSTFKWNGAVGRFELEPEQEEEIPMAPNSRLQPTRSE